MNLTPHGPGFSFLDAFAVTEPGRRGLGRKWLDPALPFFADHFPGQPLMPGVLLIECGAQTAGALWAATLAAGSPRHFILAQVVQFKIQRPIGPGGTLETDVELEKDFGALAQFAVTVRAGSAEIARGRIVLARPAA
jgi:3-hydroxyacyl-[acyl-carrier-protein] dehydratase